MTKLGKDRTSGITFTTFSRAGVTIAVTGSSYTVLDRCISIYTELIGFIVRRGAKIKIRRAHGRDRLHEEERNLVSRGPDARGFALRATEMSGKDHAIGRS